MHESNYKFEKTKSFESINIAVIKFCSFLEEFEAHKTEIKKDELRQSIEKQLVNITTKFPDIVAYRNNVLSHPFRDWGKKSIFEFKTKSYQIPQDGNDYYYIQLTTKVIVGFLRTEYPTYFKLVDSSDPNCTDPR